MLSKSFGGKGKKFQGGPSRDFCAFCFCKRSLSFYHWLLVIEGMGMTRKYDSEFVILSHLNHDSQAGWVQDVRFGSI
jgi:hypothetical protein